MSARAGRTPRCVALADAGDRARGATLYCTLEPCSHTGRTGPCAPRVVEAGVRRAVIAIEDPNPMVAGRGISYLRDRGVEVVLGVMRDEAERLNRPFFTFISRQRPFVTLKAAVSLDGMVAARKGARTAITGAEANSLTHVRTRRDRRHCDRVRDGNRRRPAADSARRLSRAAVDARDLRPPAAHTCAGADLLDARRGSSRDRDGSRRRSDRGRMNCRAPEHRLSLSRCRTLA